MNRTLSPCFCINLRRANGVLSDFYDKALANAKLTTSQFSLMKTLHRVQPCTVTALSKEMGLERTTLVRTLKPLLQHNLICDLSAEKSRNNLLSLTEEGSMLMNYATLLWEDAQAAVRAYMGEEQMEILMSLLAKLEEFTGD